MKKCLLLIFVFTSIYNLSFAKHLKGGWIYYQYEGPGIVSGTSKYLITVKQYLNCQSTVDQIDQSIFLGIFNEDDNSSVTVGVPLGGQTIEQLNLNTLNPCINPKPDANDVCYIIDSYTSTVQLQDNTNGYTLAVQRCCRIDDIVNVEPNDVTGVGVTYTTTIPGVKNGIIVRDDNSPVFAQNDVTIVCINSSFTFDFSATDFDKDSLVYSFCSGLTGGSVQIPQPPQPSSPPFKPITYTDPYSGAYPLGANAVIDTKTGIISGIAPPTPGTYVVAVCVSEYRNGLYIGVCKKEIHINVADCSLNAAQLKPEYISCNGFTFLFSNESSNENINSYLWNFGVQGVATDTSTKASPSYTYSDTGSYEISLHVSNTQGCKDSAKSLLLVYPGFTPEFAVKGGCYLDSFQFIDETVTSYGVVNNWHWNFGDNTTLADTSLLQNPFYTYPAAGAATASLIVSNSKGCTDTAYQTINIYDKPVISVPFSDTLICIIDSLQLHVSSTGENSTYSWQPLVNIINPNSANPVVYPGDTTKYIVTVNDQGCVGIDSVTVNVIKQVLVSIKPDTTICKGDTIQLSPQTNALYFAWSPATSLNNPSFQSPLANPSSTITYNVFASVGKCFAQDSKTVAVVPYPSAEAFGDTTICFGSTTQLSANIEGSSFSWSPANSLEYANTLTPVAGPQSTTAYVLSVFDTAGCPKPSSDTVLVNVIPKVIAFAGDDTAIVANQPLQLNATGGINYQWTPATGMNNPDIANPIVTLNATFDTMVYVVKVSVPPGCSSEDSLKIIVFKTQPGIFIPTGFTPNSDGRNDILRPILVGMKQLNFFSVYNRWGNLIYTTSRIGDGWDGTIKGIPQPSGTYVFIAEAVNYLGNTVTQKGTAVLIR